MPFTNRPVRKWLVLLSLVAAVALIAACGRGGDPTATPAPAATEAPAEAATEAPAETATPVPAAATEEESTEETSATEEVSEGAEATEAPAEEATGATTEETAASGLPASELDPEARNNMYAEAFPMTIDPEKYYYATIETEKGDIVVQLFADRAPVTVNNFVNLAQEGYYDNTTFHRVLQDFMAQAGDPTGTGTGGPGYLIPDEFVPGLNFDREGLLAMANTGMPGSGGSQWFLTFGPTEWLNQMHTIFGEVIEGMDVLRSITLRDPSTSPTTTGDEIISITIEERSESELPTPTPAPPTPTPFAPSSLDAADRPLADTPLEERTGFFTAPPEMTIDVAKEYTATIATSKGDMTVSLNAAEAPIAVNNFVTLANLGFYDGLTVTAVITDELVVIGSPENTPTSDAGYLFVPETNLSTEPAVGTVAFMPVQPTADGLSIQASGSILYLMLTAPLPDDLAYIGLFGAILEDDLDVLTSLTAEDTIESITITESE